MLEQNKMVRAEVLKSYQFPTENELRVEHKLEPLGPVPDKI